MLISLFFFQAEDGIRDHCVTGVQTCALPISHERFHDLKGRRNLAQSFRFFHYHAHAAAVCWVTDKTPSGDAAMRYRSEERRVGKEGRSRRTTERYKRKKSERREGEWRDLQCV